jgi:hypothetical protein
VRGDLEHHSLLRLPNMTAFREGAVRPYAICTALRVYAARALSYNPRVTRAPAVYALVLFVMYPNSSRHGRRAGTGTVAAGSWVGG